MNMPLLPPFGDDGEDPIVGLSRLADRMETAVRRYQWLTIINIIGFSFFAMLSLASLIIRVFS